MSVIRIAGVPEHFNLPWQLALQHGLFAKDNINLEWQYNDAGTGAMVKDLKEGNIDMAVLLTEGAISAIINGLEAKIIKQYISSPLIWGIHTGKNSNINNTRTLNECNYAISRKGSGSHLMAMIDAEIRGFKISENKLKLVENLKGAIPELNSNNNTVFYWEKYTTKPIVDKGLLNRIGEFVTPWSCFQIVATNNILNRQFYDIEKILRTMNFVCKQFMQADNSIDLVLNEFEMLPQDAHSWFYSTEWNTNQNISDKMLQNVMQALIKIGAISDIAPTNKLIESRLVTLE